MRIIQIGSFPLDIAFVKGGEEASVCGLAREQSKTNEVFVIDIPRTEIKKDYVEVIEGITVYRFYSKSRHNVSALRRIKKILSVIRELKPHICHIHSTTYFSLRIFLNLRFDNIPTVLTVHGIAHVEKMNAWRKEHSLANLFKYVVQSSVEFILLFMSRTIIVDTQYVADTIHNYKTHWKIISEPVYEIIPQGISPVFFEMQNKPVSGNLLSVGAISKRKGHLVLIEALEKVKVRFPDVSLTIVGTLSETGYLEEMQQLIREKRMEHCIAIHLNVPFASVLDFYRLSDIFVLHSEEESQGIVFCEAMAAGKPVISTKVGGIPWVVKHGINGLLSEYGDVDTFADHIIRLLENDVLRQEMERANKAEAQRYDWVKIEKNIMRVYKTILR